MTKHKVIFTSKYFTSKFFASLYFPSISGMYMYVQLHCCIYAGTCMVHMHIHGYACKGWRKMSSIVLHALPLYLLRQGLSIKPKAPDMANLASLLALSPLLGAGITGRSQDYQHWPGFCRSELRSLHMCGKHLPTEPFLYSTGKVFIILYSYYCGRDVSSCSVYIYACETVPVWRS